MAILRILREEQGQALSEYGLLLGLLALFCLPALTSTGISVQGMLGKVSGLL